MIPDHVYLPTRVSRAQSRDFLFACSSARCRSRDTMRSCCLATSVHSDMTAPASCSSSRVCWHPIACLIWVALAMVASPRKISPMWRLLMADPYSTLPYGVLPFEPLDPQPRHLDPELPPLSPPPCSRTPGPDRYRRAHCFPLPSHPPLAAQPRGSGSRRRRSHTPQHHCPNRHETPYVWDRSAAPR